MQEADQTYLRLCARVCKRQVAQGHRFHLEQPELSRMLSEETLKPLVLATYKVLTDMRAHWPPHSCVPSPYPQTHGYPNHLSETGRKLGIFQVPRKSYPSTDRGSAGPSRWATNGSVALCKFLLQGSCNACRPMSVGRLCVCSLARSL